MRSTFERIRRTFLPSLDALDPRITPSTTGGPAAIIPQGEIPLTQDAVQNVAPDASHASGTREVRQD